MPSVHDCSSFLQEKNKQIRSNRLNLRVIIFSNYFIIFAPQNAKILKLPTTYKTLKGTSEGQYKEKGSKFIGIAVSCRDEEEAKQFLEQWKSEHHQARHLCYAYRLGIKKDIYRANDD